MIFNLHKIWRKGIITAGDPSRCRTKVLNESMVNVSQGAVALGILTLLFGGDLYGMFGQPAEVDTTAFGCTSGSLCAQLICVCVWQGGPSSARSDLATMSDNGRVVVAYCTS